MREMPKATLEQVPSQYPSLSYLLIEYFFFTSPTGPVTELTLPEVLSGC